MSRMTWWTRELTQALDGTNLSGSPRAVRDGLALSLSAALSNLPHVFAILAFGSVARLDPAQDLDLLVLEMNDDTPFHAYARVALGSISLDLNVVNEAWLRDAPQDLEWGNWLSEAYPLVVKGVCLEALWRSASAYWNDSNRARRQASHQRIMEALVAGAAAAKKRERPLLSRLLMHEAARSMVISALDRRGSERVFSHRTLQGEYSAAGEFSAEISMAMKWDCGNDGYVELRRLASKVLRDPRMVSATGCEPGLPRVQRLCKLAECGNSSAGEYLEAALRIEGAETWLPHAVHVALPAKPLVDTGRTGRRRRISVKSVAIPALNAVAGARWVSLDGDRLKVIVSTGGCGTPTCRFCALPDYGRASGRHNVALTIDGLLAQYRPRRLALYNDGNFFNEREIDCEAVDLICDVVAAHRVVSLDVESAPRFISRARVEQLKHRSGVSELNIALGFQAVGNEFAVSRLGRPDVDSCFDWAIDKIHKAGATVRLYLLWGYGLTSAKEWAERTVASLHWAEERGADRVSICVYKAPRGEGGDGMALRELVSKWSSRNTRVDVVDNGKPSCAASYSGGVSRCPQQPTSEANNTYSLAIDHQ